MTDTPAKPKRLRAKAATTGGWTVSRTEGKSVRGITIGRAAFAKISAVEGIAPTKAAEARAADFDRRGLTPEERRQEIIKAYRPKG